MNTCEKGLKRELELSKTVHKSGTPVLASSLVLRSQNCGQVDLAVLKGQQVDLFEVKSTAAVSKRQIQRLRRSCYWLGELLNKTVHLRITQRS